MDGFLKPSMCSGGNGLLQDNKMSEPSAVDLILSLPSVLSCEILSDWLDASNLVRLDSAYCVQRMRPILRTLYEQPELVCSISCCGDKNSAWFINRKIRLCEFNACVDLPPHVVTNYLKAFGRYVTSVRLHKRTNPDVFKGVVEHCSNVSMLHTYEVDDAVLSLLEPVDQGLFNLQNVRKLHMRCLNDITFREKPLRSFVHKCSELTHFSLRYVKKLSATAVIGMLTGLSKLVALNLFALPVDDAALAIIIQHCPLIVHLDLSTNSKVTDNGMYYLATGLRLKSIAINCALGITDQGLLHLCHSADTLQELHIAQVINSRSAESIITLVAINALLSITNIRVYDWRTQIFRENFNFAVCMYATTIVIVNCTPITDTLLCHIAYRCPQLQHVYMITSDRRNQQYTSAGLYALLRSCFLLQTILVNKNMDKAEFGVVMRLYKERFVCSASFKDTSYDIMVMDGLPNREPPLLQLQLITNSMCLSHFDLVTSLPSVLFCKILSIWLDVPSLVRLDSAICNHATRPTLLALYQLPDLVCSTSVYPKEKSIWFWNKRIKLREFMMRKDLPEDTAIAYLSEFGRGIQTVHASIGVNTALISSAARYCPNVNTLITFPFVAPFALLESFPNINMLKIVLTSFTDHESKGAAFEFSKLTKLRLMCSNYQTMEQIFSIVRLSGLTHLSVTQGSTFSAPPALALLPMLGHLLAANLDAFPLDDAAVAALVEHCPLIVHLDLQSNETITDAAVYSISRKLKLKSIALPSSNQITDRSLEHLHHCASTLQRLHIAQSVGFMVEVVKLTLPAIRALLAKTHKSQFTWSTFIMEHQYNLSVCSNATDINIAPTSSRMTDEVLFNIAQHCKNLLHLDLYQETTIDHPQFTQAGLYCIIGSCTRLKSIYLSRKAGVAHFAELLTSHPMLFSFTTYNSYDVMTMA